MLCLDATFNFQLEIFLFLTKEPLKHFEKIYSKIPVGNLSQNSCTMSSFVYHDRSWKSFDGPDFPSSSDKFSCKIYLPHKNACWDSKIKR